MQVGDNWRNAKVKPVLSRSLQPSEGEGRVLRVAFFVVAACCLDGCLYPQNKKEKLLLQPSNHPTSHQRSRSGALTIFNAKASAGGWIMIMVVAAVDGFKGGME